MSALPLINAQTIAVFIDADNAQAKYITVILQHLRTMGTVNIRRAYGNWKSNSLINWEALLLQHAIKPIQQFALTKGKNATDIAMTIDVMDILHTKQVDIFALVSSDCDFMPLAMRLVAEGKQVVGFGETKTPEPFRLACSQFVCLPIEQETEQVVTPVKKAQSPLSADKTQFRLSQLVNQLSKEHVKEGGWVAANILGQAVANDPKIVIAKGKLRKRIESYPVFQLKTQNNQWLVKLKR